MSMLFFLGGHFLYLGPTVQLGHEMPRTVPNFGPRVRQGPAAQPWHLVGV